MKRIILGLAACLLFLGAAGTFADSAEEAEKVALLKLEQQSHHWWWKQDVEALDQLFDERYRLVAPNGAPEDRAIVLGEDPESRRVLEVKSLTVEPEEALLRGDTAVVLALLRIEATVRGRPVPNRMRVLSVYERVDAEASWKLVARSITPVLTPPSPS